MARKLRQIIARGSTWLVRTYQLLCCRRRDTAGGIGSLAVAARPSRCCLGCRALRACSPDSYDGRAPLVL